MVRRLAPSPHSERVPGLIPGWGLSVWSLHVLRRYSGFLLQTKNMHLRVIVNSKLSLGMSVSVYVSLTLSRVYPASRPMTAGIGSSPHATLN